MATFTQGEVRPDTESALSALRKDSKRAVARRDDLERTDRLAQALEEQFPNMTYNEAHEIGQMVYGDSPSPTKAVHDRPGPKLKSEVPHPAMFEEIKPAPLSTGVAAGSQSTTAQDLESLERDSEKREALRHQEERADRLAHSLSKSFPNMTFTEAKEIGHKVYGADPISEHASSDRGPFKHGLPQLDRLGGKSIC